MLVTAVSAAVATVHPAAPRTVVHLDDQLTVLVKEDGVVRADALERHHLASRNQLLEAAATRQTIEAPVSLAKAVAHCCISHSTLRATSKPANERSMS